jgi:hypothetical protein
MMRHELTTACTFALALAALPALAERSVSKNAPLAATGSLEVSNVAGEVVVRAWERNEISVTGEIGFAQRLEFSADGQFARVEVRSSGEGDRDDPDHESDYDEEADLLIQVPAGTRLRATTVSAGLTVEGLKSELKLQSVSGDIKAEVYGTDVAIGTISGTVWVDGHNEPGDLRVSVVSGEAAVRDVAGNLALRTVSGDLSVRAGELARTRIDTTSGEVALRATLADGARFEVDSTSGDVRLALCGKPGAEYELSSFSGEIRGLDGRRGEQRSEHGPTMELRFRVGDGGSLVRVNSLSGNISLEDC